MFINVIWYPCCIIGNDSVFLACRRMLYRRAKLWRIINSWTAFSFIIILFRRGTSLHPTAALIPFSSICPSVTLQVLSSSSGFLHLLIRGSSSLHKLSIYLVSGMDRSKEISLLATMFIPGKIGKYLHKRAVYRNSGACLICFLITFS